MGGVKGRRESWSSGDGTLRLGLDDLAQRVLGRLTSIALPKAGTSVTEGQPVADDGPRHGGSCPCRFRSPSSVLYNSKRRWKVEDDAAMERLRTEMK
jgi:hypothetical protein